MKLQVECVRDIMLAVESCGFGERLSLEALCRKLTDYTEEELWYTVIKLQEADFLDVSSFNQLRVMMPVIKSINDITYNGHEFLNTVRDKGIWEKTKSTAKSAGAFSIKALSDIGKSVAAAAITAALQSQGIPPLQ